LQILRLRLFSHPGPGRCGHGDGGPPGGGGGGSASFNGAGCANNPEKAVWTTVAQVRGNTADVTTSTVDFTARYLRLSVITPTATSDPAARIYEFEAYA